MRIYADTRHNIFTVDENCMRARMVDKRARKGLKRLILIPVFYCLEAPFTLPS